MFMHKVFTSIQKELKIITKILVLGKSSSWVIFGNRIMFSVFFVVVIFLIQLDNGEALYLQNNVLTVKNWF